MKKGTLVSHKRFPWRGVAYSVHTDGTVRCRTGFCFRGDWNDKVTWDHRDLERVILSDTGS